MDNILDIMSALNSQKAADASGGMFGGQNGIWFLLILFLFGGGRGFGGLGGLGGGTGAEMINNDFLFNNVNRELDNIQSGLVSGFSGLNQATNAGFAAVNGNVLAGNNELGKGIASSTYALNDSIKGGFNSLEAALAAC